MAIPIPSIKLAGYITLGSGLGRHVAYKCEVSREGKSWTIYRRYQAFFDLHQSLNTSFGEERIKEEGIELPEKGLGGSVIHSLKMVAKDRSLLLQAYMDVLLSSAICGQVLQLPSTEAFFDFQHQGISGLQRELGKAKILKETFALTSIGTVSLWALKFVVVIKGGTVLILNSMYDTMAQAALRINLAGGGVSVIPKARNNVISLHNTTNGDKASISFPTAAEAAFWIRTVSDFTTNASFKADVQQEQQKQKQVQQQKQQQRAQQIGGGAVEHIHAAGTGNTEDELSAMLGI